MDGRPGFPGGTPMTGAPPAAHGTVPTAMASTDAGVLSPVFADLPAGPSGHLRAGSAVAHHAAAAAAAASGHPVSSAGHAGHLQGKYYQPGITAMNSGSGYPYLSAYIGGGSPGAYKPPGSSQPSPASLAAAATTGLHMPHYWPSSAETTSRGYHGYPMGSPHLYSPYYHMPSSSADSISSTYSMPPGVPPAKTEGPLPASFRTWDSGLSSLSSSNPSHGSKDSSYGMSGSHILAQIGRRTPTESTKAHSRHSSGKSVAETKTSPKDSSTTSVSSAGHHKSAVKRDEPHREEASKHDGKKGESAKHSGKKAKVNVPGSDELPKTIENKATDCSNKSESKTENKSSAKDSPKADAVCSGDKKIDEIITTTKTKTDNDSPVKDKTTDKVSDQILNIDKKVIAGTYQGPETNVSTSTTDVPPAVSSSQLSSASVPLSITIPAPSTNLMPIPPNVTSSNILVPSAQTISTSAMTSTPIMSPTTKSSTKTKQPSPKASKSGKLASPTVPKSVNKDNLETNEKSDTKTDKDDDSKKSSQSPTSSPVSNSATEQEKKLAGQAKIGGHSPSLTAKSPVTQSTTSTSDSTTVARSSVTSAPVSGTAVSTTTTKLGSSDTTSITTSSMSTTNVSSCSTHQHPHPGFVSGHLPIYLHGAGHLTLKRESSREVPRDGSKVHATTFVPALGEFIPGPACSAGASKEGKARGSVQQKDSNGSSSGKGSGKKDGGRSLTSPRLSSSGGHGNKGNADDKSVNSTQDGGSSKVKESVKSELTQHKDRVTSPSSSTACKSAIEKGDRTDKSKRTLTKVGNVTVPGGLEVKVSQYDSSTKEHPIKSSMSPSSGSDRDSVPHRTHSTGSEQAHGRMSNPPCFSPPSMHPYSALAGYPPPMSPHHMRPHEMPSSLSSEEQRRYLEWHYAASAAKRGYYYEPPTLRLPGQEMFKTEQRHSYPSPKSDGRLSSHTSPGHPSPRLVDSRSTPSVETKQEGSKQEKSCQREQAPASYGSPPESMLRSVLTAGIHRPLPTMESQRTSPTNNCNSTNKNQKHGSSSEEKPHTLLKSKNGSDERIPGRSTPGTKSGDGRHPPVGIAVAQKRQDSETKGQRSASNSSRSSTDSPHVVDATGDRRSRSRDHSRSGIANASDRDSRHSDLPEFNKHHQRHVGELSSNLVVTGGGSMVPSPRHISHRESTSTPTTHPQIAASPHWLSARTPGQHPSPYWLGSPYGMSPHGPPPPGAIHHTGDMHGHIPVAPPGLQLARDPTTGQLVLIPQQPSPSEAAMGMWPYLVPSHVNPHSHQLQQLMLNQPSYGHLTPSQHAQLLAGRPDQQHPDFHLALQQQQEALAHWYHQAEQMQREERYKREQQSHKPLQEKAAHKVESTESKGELCQERKFSDKGMRPSSHGSADSKIPLQQSHSYLSANAIPISAPSHLPIVYPPPPTVQYLYNHTGGASVYPVPSSGSDSKEKKEAGTSFSPKSFSPKSFSPKSSTKTNKKSTDSVPTSENKLSSDEDTAKTAVKSISIQTSTPSASPSEFDDIDVTTVSSPEKQQSEDPNEAKSEDDVKSADEEPLVIEVAKTLSTATVSKTVSTTMSTKVSTTLTTAVSTTVATTMSTTASSTMSATVSTATSTAVSTAVSTSKSTSMSTAVTASTTTTLGSTMTAIKSHTTPKTDMTSMTSMTSPFADVKSIASSKFAMQPRTSTINIEPQYRKVLSKEEDTISKIIQSVAKTMEKSARSSENSSKDSSDEEEELTDLVSRSGRAIRTPGMEYDSKKEMDKEDESSQESASLVLDDRRTESTDLSPEPEEATISERNQLVPVSRCSDISASASRSSAASNAAAMSRFASSFGNSSKESLLSSVLTTSHSMASRMEGLDQDQLAAIEGIALLSEMAEQKAFARVATTDGQNSKSIVSKSDDGEDLFARESSTPLQGNAASAVTCANSALQETIETTTTSAGEFSVFKSRYSFTKTVKKESTLGGLGGAGTGHASGSVTPLGSDAMNPSELEMRMKLAELQRKYKEKKRELDKLQRKKDKKDKGSRSHHLDKKRGPGRPRKRKFSKDSATKEDVKDEEEDKREEKEMSLQLSTAVLLEAAASLEEQPVPKKKKRSSEGKEKKKKGSKDSGEKSSSKSKKKKHRSRDENGMPISRKSKSKSKSSKNKGSSKSKKESPSRDAAGNIIPTSKSSKSSSKSSKSKSPSKSSEPKIGPMKEPDNYVVKQKPFEMTTMATIPSLSEIDGVDTDSGSIIWPSNSSSSGKPSSKSKSKNSKKKSKKDKKSKSNSSKHKDEKSSSSLTSPVPIVKDGIGKETVVKDTTMEAIESVIRSHTCHSDGEVAMDSKMPAPDMPLTKPKLELSIDHVYGDDSDSTMEDENHWSNHKGLALLAGLSAQHGSGTSTPVKGSNNSTPCKPKKSQTSQSSSSKLTEKVKNATSEGSGTDSFIKKKSKSKKRSSSKGSTDEPNSKKSKKSSSSKSAKRDRRDGSSSRLSKSSSKCKKKNRSSSSLPSTPRRKTDSAVKREEDAKDKLTTFDVSSWSRRRSERIFLSDTSPIHSRDVSPHMKSTDPCRGKKQLSLDSPPSGKERESPNKDRESPNKDRESPSKEREFQPKGTESLSKEKESQARNTSSNEPLPKESPQRETSSKEHPGDIVKSPVGEAAERSPSEDSNKSPQGVSNIGIVLDALKTDPAQIRKKLLSMSTKDEDGGKKAKKVVKKPKPPASSETKVAVTSDTATQQQQRSPVAPPPLVKMPSQDSQDASYSEGENLPLSNYLDKPLTPPPRSCIIKQEELSDGLRVLIPIEGLFYAGYVHAIQAPDVYGVIIDGQRGNRPHVFSQEQILQEAIVDVRPGSTKYLPEDTRICAYWSQQFRCLYPGTVVKGTPNPMTDASFVCVEFDDGDSGRIPLDHIRMLPHDYPIVDFEPSPIVLQRKRKRQASEASSSAEWKSEFEGGKGQDGSNPDRDDVTQGTDKSKKKATTGFETLESTDAQDTGTISDVGDDDVFVQNSNSSKKKSKKVSKSKKSGSSKSPKNKSSRDSKSKKKRSSDSKHGNKDSGVKSFKNGEKKSRSKKDGKVKKKKVKDGETGTAEGKKAKSTKRKTAVEKGKSSSGGSSKKKKSKQEKKKNTLCTLEVETCYEDPIMGEEQTESDEQTGADSKRGKNYADANGGDNKDGSQNGDTNSDKDSDENGQGGRDERLPSSSKMAGREVILDARSSFLPARQLWRWCGKATQRRGTKGKARKVFYKAITREKELIRVGECAVFLSTGRPHLPYVGRIESMWESWGGNMVVKVKWFYHPEETKGGRKAHDGDMALYQSPHVDENDVQTISHKCEVLSTADFKLYETGNETGKKLKLNMDESDVYYLAGNYDPTNGNTTAV